MKTKPQTGPCRLELRLAPYANSYYISRVARLRAVIARVPLRITLTLIGEGEIPADTTLLIRSVLSQRSPKTELVTDARSSLTGAAVLVWLLGDRRIIREDARLFFKRNLLEDEDPVEVYAGLGSADPKYKDSYTFIDPTDADYTRVLALIDDYLPVNEFAGRIVTVDILREFGLIENEQVERLLAAVLAKSPAPKTRAARGRQLASQKGRIGSTDSDDSQRQE